VSRFGSDQERRRRQAQALYEFETALHEEGISDLGSSVNRGNPTLALGASLLTGLSSAVILHLVA
jgi:hypothetical protein